MKIPETIDGFEVHPQLDDIVDKQKPLELPPPAVYTELLKDPILNALTAVSYTHLTLPTKA